MKKKTVTVVVQPLSKREQDMMKSVEVALPEKRSSGIVNNLMMKVTVQATNRVETPISLTVLRMIKAQNKMTKLRLTPPKMKELIFLNKNPLDN